MCVFAPVSRADTKVPMSEPTILVIIDPDRADHPAIGRGVRLARGSGAALELYTCDVEREVPEQWAGAMSSQQARMVLREGRLQLLEQLAQPLRAEGLCVGTHSDWHPSLEQGVLRHIVATKPGVVLEDELYDMRERLHAAEWTARLGR